MKKPLLLAISAFSIIAIMTLESYKNGPASGGVQATAAPGSSSNKCTSCHTGGGGFGTVSVDMVLMTDSSVAVTEYTPGATYSIIATVSNSSGSPSGYGIQMVSLKTSDNSKAGELANPSANAKLKTLSGRQYFEQSAPSALNVFTVDWTAPAEGTGDVKFYFGANAVNGNNQSSGDKAVLSDFTFAEAIPDTVDSSNSIIELRYKEFSLYPNPASEFVYLSGKMYVNNAQLFNMNGSEFELKNLESNKLDVSNLPKGMYYLIEGDQVARFIKQ